MKYLNPTLAGHLKRRPRLVLYASSYVAVLVLQTGLYWWGMNTLEGEPRTVLDALGVVVQSHSTAGYGQDAPWSNPVLQVLVIAMQFTGFTYLFVALPLFVVPWIRSEVVEPTVPDAVEDIEDHVVLCGYAAVSRTLAQDLAAHDVPYVVVEGDEERARELYRDDEPVVHGDPTGEGTFDRVHVDAARAVVVDVRQTDGIETVLTIREVDREVDVLVLIDEVQQSQYLRYAGATTVLSPKHRLGKSLADKAGDVVKSDVEYGDDVDGKIDIAEFPVAGDSRLHGRRPDQFDELEEIGAKLVGAWIRGDFVTTFGPGDYLDRNTVLVLAGTESQLERVGEFTRSRGRFPTPGPVIVAGLGVTGRVVEGILEKTDRTVTTVDVDASRDPDVVGDVTDSTTLQSAGVSDASTVVLALSDEDASIRATLAANELATDAEILVATTDPDNVGKLYSAGADFVLALPKLAGRMVTLALLEEDVMTLHEQIHLDRLDGAALEGRLPANEEVRESTGSVLVAVRRNGHVETDVDDGLDVGDDELIVAGTDVAVRTFESEFAS